jgi:hypothetical protein
MFCGGQGSVMDVVTLGCCLFIIIYLWLCRCCQYQRAFHSGCDVSGRVTLAAENMMSARMTCNVLLVK